MAYKSLIDYYGGGMVNPPQGYQLGGQIARSGRQRGYTREFKNLKDLAEQSAKRREKVGGNWLRKLAVGTAGTLLGGPMGGGAALAADQALRERKFKKTDFGGGKYAQDVREKLGKQEKAFKDKGLMRVGIAGVEGYLGGKSGGTYGKAAGGIKDLGSNIGMIKGAMAGEGGASFLEAAKGVGWDIPSMFGGKSSVVGSLLPSVAPKAMNAPSFYGNTTDEQDVQQWSGRPSDFAMDANTTDEQDFQQWAGVASDFAMGSNTTDEQDFQQWAGVAGTPDQAAVTQPLTSIQRGDILGNEYMERVRAGVAGGQEPELNQPLQVDVFGSSPEPDTTWSQSPIDWYDQPDDEYPSYGSPIQQPQTQMAGGISVDWQGGGLVDYMMPQNYQSGGYATATDPQQALRQMGMGDVADDPELEKHLEDLPQFGMGYKQQFGDIMAGGRSSLMGLAQQSRAQQAGTGFAGGGAGAVGQAMARKELERGVGTKRRGVVEGYQSDLLSAIADIEQKIGGDFTFGNGGDQNTYALGEAGVGMEASGIPEGWPSRQAFDSWRDAGGDPDTAVNYGWQATGSNTTPGGYKS